MSARKLLAAEGAGLVVAGFAAAALLLRGQREASRRMCLLESNLDDVRYGVKETGKTLRSMLEITADEVDARRKARERQ